MDLIIFPDDNIEMTENLLFQDQVSSKKVYNFLY